MSEYRDDVTAYMLLSRETWETALTKLEQIGRIDAARTLAIEVSNDLTLHAPYAWLDVVNTVAPNSPP